MPHAPRRQLLQLLGFGLGVALILAPEARAQWPRARRVRVVPTVAPSPTYAAASARRAAGLAPSPMLGTFYPDPYVNIRGNFETGGGYSPLGTYGDNTAALYGPLSSFRETSAPVLMYERGYNGAHRPGLGTGFSKPNFPPASPAIVYPSRANAVNAQRNVLSPPQWDSGINWIDLN